MIAKNFTQQDVMSHLMGRIARAFLDRMMEPAPAARRGIDPKGSRSAAKKQDDPDHTEAADSYYPHIPPVARLSTPLLFVVDGSCIGRDIARKGWLSLEILDRVRSTLVELYPESEVVIKIDARRRHACVEGKRAFEEWTAADPHRRIVEPGGQQADHFVLGAARMIGAIVVSNDMFKDRRELRVNVPLLPISYNKLIGPQLGEIIRYPQSQSDAREVLALTRSATGRWGLKRVRSVPGPVQDIPRK